MPIPLKKNHRYMAGIDGLRAIAVLSVIAYHLQVPWAKGGLLGVVIFFVLSGYLITDLLVMEWKKDGRINLMEFWKRRIRRLLPAHFVMVIVVMAWITLFKPTLLPTAKGDLLASLFYVSNWWFIFHKVSYFESFGTPSPFNHLWSLAVEEQFYLCWPVLLTLGLTFIRRKALLVGLILFGALVSFLLMAIVYQPGTDPSRVYYGTDTRVFSLLFGSILALIWPSRKLSKHAPKFAQRTLDSFAGISLVLILIMIGLTNQFDSFLYEGGMVLTSIAAFILVAALAHPASKLSKLMAFKPLRWLGVRSYSMYLWHYPVILFTSPSVNDTHVHIFRMCFQLCLIFVLAALSWCYIENPIRNGAFDRILIRLKEKRSLWKDTSSIQKVVMACSAVIVLIACAGVFSFGHEEKGHASNGIESVAKEAEQSNDKRLAKKVSNIKSVAVREGIPQESDSAITAIGDSVMVMAAPYLEKEIPGIVIDAKVGRQMSQASAVISRLQSEENLGKEVIIELGTNGPFTKDELVSLIDSLGPNRKIILVNCRVSRPWEREVNSIIEEVASSSPNIYLADWYSESVGKNSYFYSDGVHPNQKGAQLYVSLIARTAQLDQKILD